MSTKWELNHKCNKLQGNDSWAIFLKKYAVEDPEVKAKTEQKMKINTLQISLAKLSIKQLKSLAELHGLKIKGQVVEDWLNSHTKAPTKKQYVDKLKSVVTEKELKTLPKEESKPPNKKKSNSDDSWF